MPKAAPLFIFFLTVFSPVYFSIYLLQFDLAGQKKKPFKHVKLILFFLFYFSSGGLRQRDKAGVERLAAGINFRSAASKKQGSSRGQVLREPSSNCSASPPAPGHRVRGFIVYWPHFESMSTRHKWSLGPWRRSWELLPVLPVAMSSP